MADSIREALTSAFAADEKEEISTPVVAEATPEVVPDTSIADPAAPVIGSEAPPAPKPAEAAKPSTSATPPAGATPVATPAPIAAPASWKAAEKAFWDKIPPEARAAVMRREQETQRVLSHSAEARKHQQSFQQAMTPYQPLFDAYGVKDPIQALIPLMQTRAALEVGNPDQKAQLVANLVHQFGIDIQKLDGFLVKGPTPQAPVQQALDPRSIPELQPLFQIAEQFKQQQETKVAAAIAEVESLPHFEELREDMADVLDRAAARGKSLTVKQAYDVAAGALGLTPAPAVPSAANVSEAAAMLAKSRKAASSVAGAPKGAAGSKPSSLRDTIEAAMNG